MCQNISKIYSASRATIIKTHLVGMLEKKNIDQAWKCCISKYQQYTYRRLPIIGSENENNLIAFLQKDFNFYFCLHKCDSGPF